MENENQYLGQECKFKYTIGMMDRQLAGEIANAVIKQLAQDNVEYNPQDSIGTISGDGCIDISIEVTFL
jgi:hypothetical protein